MKSHILLSSCMTALLVFAGCNGSGVGSTVPTDGLFGEMPRLALENRQLVIGGLDELSEAGSKGQQESIIEKNHAEKAELHKRIEKAGKEIEGKKILIEIGEGLPFKVAEPAVIGESCVRGINMSTAIKNAILESTEEIMVGDRVPGKFDRATKLTLIAVDKNGIS